MNAQEKYKNIRRRDASPPAAAMVKSLRDLGYTPETAVSDIIDNAIFAGAKNVWIDFVWNGLTSRITFRDDGAGMDEEALALAMRPGSQNPTEERDPKDLGRFGLGLKTASFSQCTLFTVLSKTEFDPITTWRWDLDYVINTEGGWNILEIADDEDIEVLKDMKTGTLVVWENLDRIVGTPESRNTQDHFLQTAEKVKRHLEMVFHRYLENGKLNINFNGHQVKAWDPFLRGEVATQPFPEEKFSEGEITVKPYILPHRSKLAKEIWDEGENRGGWDDLQGFYIYRNERLLLAADWLGFRRKRSHYKLARIMVDLPNHLDHDWQIDIKKSTARPPALIRQDLRAVINTTVMQAEQVFRHRGKEVQRSLSGEFSFVWKEVVKNNRYFFRINEEHPVVASVLQKFETKQRKEIHKLIRIIEETVPGPAVISKENEYPDSMLKPFEETPPDEMIGIISELMNGWLNQGMDTITAKKKLMMTEPFSDYPHYIETLTDD